MKIKIGLLARIALAIALGILIGSFAPEGLVRLLATFNGIFGNFLGFIVPLIIIAFIAPGIAQLGSGSGKLLGLATFFAYASTLFAGFMAMIVAMNLLPTFIKSNSGKSFENPEEFLASLSFK
jgi:Na+/H+-dicarboxylate symporter